MLRIIGPLTLALVLLWSASGCALDADARVETDVASPKTETGPQQAATSQPTNVNVEKGGSAIVAPSAETVESSTGQSGIGNISVAVIGGSGLLFWIVFSSLADRAETARMKSLVDVVKAQQSLLVDVIRVLAAKESN